MIKCRVCIDFNLWEWISPLSLVKVCIGFWLKVGIIVSDRHSCLTINNKKRKPIKSSEVKGFLTLIISTSHHWN